MFLQHPQIQKESEYIKYLCCDDAWTMNLWVTGIRIAKVTNRCCCALFIEEVKLTRLLFQYGAELHQNYQTAEKKAAVNSAWTNRSTPSSSNASTPSPTTRGRVFGNPSRCAGAESARLFFFFFNSQISESGQRSRSQSATRSFSSSPGERWTLASYSSHNSGGAADI